MIPCVWILLPVHNRRDITEQFICSLLRQKYQNYHLILIDDGSTDGTSDMVRANIPTDKLTIISGTGDWWWAGCLQKGIDWLNSHVTNNKDIVLIINDDVKFPSTFLENGVDFVQKNPTSLLLSRYLNVTTREVMETGITVDFRNMKFNLARSANEINCLSTRGLFLRWEICKLIGGFYPRLLPHYGSDYEFTIRAYRKGFKLCTDPSVCIIPDHAATGMRIVQEIPDIRTLFSKKCLVNPIYRSIFVILITPIQWLPLNLVRVWVRSFINIIKILKH